MSALRPNRRKDRNKDPDGLAYLEFLTTQRCLVCLHVGRAQRTHTEAAHIGGNMAAKSNNFSAVPLCFRPHHQCDPESEEKLKKRFWEHYGLDRNAEIAKYRDLYEESKSK